MKYLILIFIFLVAGCASSNIKNKPETMDSNSGSLFTPDSIKLKGIEKKNSKELDFMFAMANEYFDLEKYEESKKIYLDIINSNPENENVQFCHYNLGLINNKLLNFKESVKHFEMACLMLKKKDDKIDAFLNYLESLKKISKWDLVLKESEDAINTNQDGIFDEKVISEISLRMAEATIMTGKSEEGRKLAHYWEFEIRKKYPRYEAVYIPELAFANYVAAMSFVYDFNKIKLDDNIDTLTEKCRNIIEAQTEFIKSINVGVIFWSNASAFEISKMYLDLYTEMENFPVPEDLNDEEKEVYKCELWNKTSNLLKKSRKVLVKSVDTAKKIKEENEYLEKSSAMIKKIDEIYESKESICCKFIKNQEIK